MDYGCRYVCKYRHNAKIHASSEDAETIASTPTNVIRISTLINQDIDSSPIGRQNSEQHSLSRYNLSSHRINTTSAAHRTTKEVN